MPNLFIDNFTLSDFLDKSQFKGKRIITLTKFNGGFIAFSSTESEKCQLYSGPAANIKKPLAK